MALQYTVSGSVTVTVTWENAGDLETLKKGLANMRQVAYESSTRPDEDPMSLGTAAGWKEMAALAGQLEQQI